MAPRKAVSLGFDDRRDHDRNQEETGRLRPPAYAYGVEDGCELDPKRDGDKGEASERHLEQVDHVREPEQQDRLRAITRLLGNQPGTLQIDYMMEEKSDVRS
jgi:hypothetical protein